MEVLTILLPLAIGLGAIFVLAFIWAAKAGQYDDLETPKYKVLIDDNKQNGKKNE